MSTLTFFRKFLHSPGRVGAVMPSSHALADRMCQIGGVGSADLVVEAGAGTGVFTKKILEQLPASSRFLSIEIDPYLAQVTRDANPTVDLVCDCATNVAQHLSDRGLGKVDVIVSGLPWAVFSEELQSDLIRSFLAVLKPGGSFVTFAYLQGLHMPAGKRFSKRLDDSFTSVERSAPVWRNVPPAIVIKAVKDA